MILDLLHVISYRDVLPNATADRQSSGWAYDCKVELMSEVMVYGTKVWANSGYEVGCINSQLPLFVLAPEYILTVASAIGFVVWGCGWLRFLWPTAVMRTTATLLFFWCSPALLR